MEGNTGNSESVTPVGESSLAVNSTTVFCSACGKPMSAMASACPQCGHPVTKAPSRNSSPKSKVTVILLCFFLGGFGIHRYYVGKIGTGIIMTLTLGCLGIWTIIDFIYAVCGKFKDSNGLLIDQ